MLNCYVGTAAKAVGLADGIVTPRTRGSIRTRHRCACPVHIDAQVSRCPQEENDDNQPHDFKPRVHALSL